MEYAIIFLPLIGSILGYLGKSLIKFFSEIVTSLFVFISAILSIVLVDLIIDIAYIVRSSKIDMTLYGVFISLVDAI